MSRSSTTILILLIPVLALLVLLMILSGYLEDRPSEPNEGIIANSTDDPNELRLISLTPNITEILYELGLGDQVAGVSTFTTRPPEVKNKPVVGSLNPDLETILRLEPTHIFAYDMESHRAALRAIQTDTIRIEYFTVETIDDIYDAIHRIGQLCNVSKQAGEVVIDIRSGLDDVLRRMQDTKPLSVLWVIQREPLMVAGQDTYITGILRICNATNAAGETLSRYPSLGAEHVMRAAPDVIIETTSSTENLDKQQGQALQYWRKFASIPAVKNERIYLLDADAVSVPGPRVVQAARTVACRLRPEQCDEPKAQP